MDAGQDNAFRLIDEAGRPLGDPVAAAGLDGAGLRALYEHMVVVRRIDAEGAALQRQGELGIWTPCLGQEAAQVGSATALGPEDVAFPSYREHGVAYVRGLDPALLLVRPRGTALSGWALDGRGFAPYTIPVGTQALHAVGYALGVKWDGAATCTVAYFGDGATSTGDVNEALNIAAVTAAPVVFFCQNNGWAISVPLARQAAAPLARRAAGFGLASVRVDGNDVLAVHAATREALERARSGGGPTFIEALTWRLGPHTTADDPTRYRSEEDSEPWRALDPIARYRAFLEHAGLWSAELEASAQERAAKVAASLRAALAELADPPASDLVSHVYADPPATLRRQWARLQAFEAALEPSPGDGR